MAPRITAAVFASGSGTNAENILRFALERPEALSIPFVVCNQPGAGVIARAEKLGFVTKVIPVQREGFSSFKEARLAQEQKVVDVMEEHGVSWAFLAGYMQILGPVFLGYFADPAAGRNRIVNIHPSLLPAFPGKDGYGDAWSAGVEESGVTLHYVDEGIDTGPVIAQKSFPRLPDDSFEDFRARGMQLEYQIYREFLASLVNETAKETGT